MNRFLPILSIGLLLSGLLTLFTPLFASAASVYDTLIETTDKLELIDNTGKITDITTTYAGIIEDKCSADAWNNWKTTTQHSDGRWAINQMQLDSSGATQINFYGSTNITDSAVFGEKVYPTLTFQYLSVPSDYQISLTKSSSGSIDCYYNSNRSNTNYLQISSNAETYKTKLLLSTYPVIYPDNYEGVTIPDSVEIKPTKNKHFPVVAWNYNGDKNINATTIYNKNQICIKNTNYACFDGEMTIQYKLYNATTDELIDEKLINHWERYDSPEIELDKTYYLGVKYVPKIEIPLAPIYDEIPEIKFLIESNGKMKSGSNYTVKCENSGDTITCEDAPLLENCLTEDAPWIDLNGCIKNMTKIVESLSFGQIKFFNVRYSYNNIGGCQELYPIPTIGSWLNLKPGERYVCPVFKKEIIDIVTPFITIALGLVLVKFLTRVGRNGND